MASNLTAYTPIPNSSDATPGLWDRRFEQVDKNVRSVNSSQIDGSASVNSLAGRLYVAGRLQPQQYLEFKQAGGATSRISSRGAIDISANQGALILDSSLRVETQYGGSAVMTVGGASGVIINSGVTFTVGGAGKPFVLRSNSAVPTTSGDAGTAGTVAWDEDYIYICASTGSWRRVALSGY